MHEFLALSPKLKLGSSLGFCFESSQGDLSDHDSIVEAVKLVDVVISAVGREQLKDQVKVVEAIKQVGHIKVSDEFPFLGSLLAHCVWTCRSNFLGSALHEFAQRFIPSIFSSDATRAYPLPASSPLYEAKIFVQQAVRASGIPYTFVCSNSFAGLFIPLLLKLGPRAPPGPLVIFGHAQGQSALGRTTANWWWSSLL